MLAVFCLRLAAGMTACLLLLPPSQVHFRFYRVHFLVALGMSIRPLLLLLALLAAAAVLRMAAEGAALAGWTGRPPFASLNGEVLLWLPVRWLLGFAGTLGLTWMAWQTAKIRSTQSAT